MTSSPVAVFWFRRDLRIDDNHGLARAFDKGHPVLPIFIFDELILKKLEPDDARVSYIHHSVTELDKDLRGLGSRLHVHYGTPEEVFCKLFAQHNISAVVTNEDYEPYAISRDKKIADLARHHGADFFSFKDHVIFAKDEISKDDGSPYKVYTPYSRRWLARFETEKIPSYPSAKRLEEAAGHGRTIKDSSDVPSLQRLGFKPSAIAVPEMKIHPSVIRTYAERRDFMALNATTKIGVHLRFGTISIRQAARLADKNSAVWLKELIWREFFQTILFHFPTTVDHPFDSRFEKFPWRESAADFKRWSDGRTGYPIVDAGMRELNETGFMHNRARMIVGSFLCKHLLLNWKEGERYFAKKLFDFELASNVGNWQWVAGCGVDAAPYFRIFNPELQTKRFDKSLEYVKLWVSEYGTKKYPEPMVDHEHARRRALTAYDKIKTAKKN